MNEDSRDDSIGCIGIVLIVLLVLWATGYYNKPRCDNDEKQAQNPPAEVKK